ncbi:pentapeptide repeat-containing protein [candidate division KSB1 bacterium]|nr:pentapeptide repeat-containing protein [candidate division KSB1 bacterium]
MHPVRNGCQHGNPGEADLHEAILSGANLSSANFIRADLSMEPEFYSECFSQITNKALLR